MGVLPRPMDETSGLIRGSVIADASTCIKRSKEIGATRQVERSEGSRITDLWNSRDDTPFPLDRREGNTRVIPKLAVAINGT